MIRSPASRAVHALAPKDVMPKWCLTGRNGSRPSVSSSMSSSRATAYLVTASLPPRSCPRIYSGPVVSPRVTSMDGPRPGVTDLVHIGLVVDDLDETVRFLGVLGFDCGKPGVFSGPWIDRI